MLISAASAAAAAAVYSGRAALLFQSRRLLAALGRIQPLLDYSHDAETAGLLEN